jgi:stage II sporulation protein E
MNSEQNNNDFFEMETKPTPSPSFLEDTKAFFIKTGRILIGTPENELGMSEAEKKQILIKGAYVCMFFLLGFLFERISLPFGAYAIVNALIGGASTHCISISLGALSAMAVDRVHVSHYFALAILLILRILGRLLLDKSSKDPIADIVSFIKYDLFTENIFLRMSAVSVSVFSVGLWSIIENGFRYYDLWGALLGMVIAPAAAFIFSMFFDAETKNARNVALAAFLICAVYSLKCFDGMGPFLCICASQVITLAAVRRYPPIYALSMATLLGLICDVSYIPMFLLSGAAYVCINFFFKERESASFFVSLAVSVIWGAVINGREALYTVFPAILAAAAVDNLLKALLPGISVEEFVSAKTRQSLLTVKENEERLKRMSESFQNLSEAFKRLSDRLSRPGIFEIRKECDDILDSFCNDCELSSVCWGEDYNTTIGFLNDASTHLGNVGKIDRSTVPQGMRDRCKAIDDIIKEINERVKILYRDSLEKDKLTVFSADYSALSRVISEAVNARQAENEENKELTMHALSMLGKYKNDFHTVSVWGKRKIRVFARLKTVSENTVGMREFKRIMEQCCGCSFANPSLKIEGKSMTITLNMRPVFAVEAASSRQSADGLPICGDSPSYFNGHDNYFYALISDGMGTGANAALTSGICEIFLHEMLEGGNRVDTSVNMLNAVIASKGNECSATVDIMELDLYSGSRTFLKSGAASSFILRGGSVYKLSARTMPLGIIDEADTDLQRVRLEDGDTIFLVSDGAAPLENYDHLINIIKSTSDEDTPEELCKRVVDLTKKNSKDDVSCVAVKIKALK